MSEILKRCPIGDCPELIPLTAEDCGKPVCPCCGRAHTRWHPRTREKTAVLCEGCVKLRKQDGARQSLVASPDELLFPPPPPRKKLSDKERARLDAEQRKLDAAVVPSEGLNQEMLLARRLTSAGVTFYGTGAFDLEPVDARTWRTLQGKERETAEREVAPLAEVLGGEMKVLNPYRCGV